jgi:hypothetical protein
MPCVGLHKLCLNQTLSLYIHMIPAGLQASSARVATRFTTTRLSYFFPVLFSSVKSHLGLYSAIAGRRPRLRRYH